MIDILVTVPIWLLLVLARLRWHFGQRNLGDAPGRETGMKVFNTSFTLQSEGCTEISDITKIVREAIQQSPISAGIALINTMHTTCALFINEFQSALIDDLKGLVERLVPERAGYRHDDPRFSDCERGNAHSHLRAALLGRSIAIGVNDGELTLGRFQSIIFAEFDGPRKREIAVQVIGE
jgi:secondary thiamine-phosphate synthase enzyme